MIELKKIYNTHENKRVKYEIKFEISSYAKMRIYSANKTSMASLHSLNIDIEIFFEYKNERVK